VIRPETLATSTSVSVIIVTHNSERLLDHCVNQFIRSQGDLQLETLLVDAGSRDPRYLSRYRDAATVILRQNEGFGASCNVGAVRSSGRWLLFLNCDVEISGQQIAELVALGDAAGLAVVAPRLASLAGEYVSFGRTQGPPWRKKPTILTTSLTPELSQQIRFVGTVSGACMLVSRRWFDAIRGFDPRFFMYSEEVDLHKRIAQRGGAIGVANEVLVLHLREMGSEGVSPRWRFVERLVGHTVYMNKHYGLLAGVVDTGWSLARIISLARYWPIPVSLRQYLMGVAGGRRRSRA
jgi:N-acetylglucosaminyl-diphospho-decaprenol L-rhamnosyltransferase